MGDPLFEYNIVFSRFINWPDTIRLVGYMPYHEPRQLADVLHYISGQGSKVWGNAYVITTHGQKMDKVTYLTEQVLADVYKLGLHDWLTGVGALPTCSNISRALQKVDGIGSFLAAQVVADLKNTPGHPLYTAPDIATFVEPGPGSIRGLAWIYDDMPGWEEQGFMARFQKLRNWVDQNWPDDVPRIDNQDLQNCLCEFDKYCRVATGSGRSKRKYNGK